MTKFLNITDNRNFEPQARSALKFAKKIAILGGCTIVGFPQQLKSTIFQLFSNGAALKEVREKGAFLSTKLATQLTETNV